VWSWLALGVAFAILGTLLLVKVVGGADGPGGTSLTVTSSTVFAEVTAVPMTVSDAVGVTSPAVPIVAPQPVRDMPLLTGRTRRGTRQPIVLFVGAEYCSFCAAERWPLIIALSRFGRFDTLYDVDSSAVDFAPSTPSFSFYGTRYSSTLVDFKAFEVATDVLGEHGYGHLMRVPHSMQKVMVGFDPTSVYPFVDVADRLVVLQTGFSPETLAGLSRDQVAAGLIDPTNPVTQAIIATANELTASICDADGEQPTTVCQASGTLAADQVLHLAG
jgi:hypothetical protein